MKPKVEIIIRVQNDGSLDARFACKPIDAMAALVMMAHQMPAFKSAMFMAAAFMLEKDGDPTKSAAQVTLVDHSNAAIKEHIDAKKNIN